MRPVPTVQWLRLALVLALALVGPLSMGWAFARTPIYVSSWAVRVSQGYQDAERLARKFGFVNLGQVGREGPGLMEWGTPPPPDSHRWGDRAAQVLP